VATTFTITDLDNVTVSVDGAVVGTGAFTDILLNQKDVAGIRGDLWAAVKRWAADVAQARDDAHAAALADLRDRKDARIAELQADKDHLQALVDALGGTEMGKQMRRDQRRQAAEAARAKAEADLAAIEAEAP
jgi:hypothetical protein